MFIVYALYLGGPMGDENCRPDYRYTLLWKDNMIDAHSRYISCDILVCNFV